MDTDQKPGNLATDNNNSIIQAVLKQISSCCEEEKNLMVGVFDVKKNKFLYCNDSFQNVLGYQADEIIRGGWEFWYKKINNDEAGIIKDKINFLIRKPHSGKHKEVLSFTYHIKGILGEWFFVSHELTLYHFKKNLIVLNYLYDISQIERIECFFEKKQNTLNKYDDNIIISKREKEVLMLIAEGFSSKQIADELSISNHTAIKHRKNMIEKFKVKNTAQLIKEASKSISL